MHRQALCYWYHTFREYQDSSTSSSLDPLGENKAGLLGHQSSSSASVLLKQQACRDRRISTQCKQHHSGWAAPLSVLVRIHLCMCWYICELVMLPSWDTDEIHQIRVLQGFRSIPKIHTAPVSTYHIWFLSLFPPWLCNTTVGPACSALHCLLLVIRNQTLHNWGC